MTGNQAIDRAFEDLGVIQPGESITTALRTQGQDRLNEVLSLLSTEGATVYTQKTYSKTLTSGTSEYTVGSGGDIDTAERVQRLTSWKCVSGDLADGGPVVSLAELASAMRAEQERIAGIALQGVMAGQITTFPATISKAVPSVVGADTAYPLIHMHVFPAPSANSTIILAGWIPLTAITDFTATMTLPSGWDNLLHWALAAQLYPQYERVATQTRDTVFGNYNAIKSSIVNQNGAGAAPAGAQQ